MQRGPGFLDYVKAAFTFRWPTRWFGPIPFNQLALAAGGVFACLFLVAGKLSAAAGVVLLTSAYEILYLYLVTSLPRFRAMVQAEAASRRRDTVALVREVAAQKLEKRSQERYEAMLGTCRQIETELAATGGDADWAHALRTGGLAELQAMFLRLLQHRDGLRIHFSSPSARILPDEIDTVRKQLKDAKLSEAVRRSKERTLDILQRRQENLNHMVQSHELADSELQRIEQQLELLREQAVISDDVGGMVGQIDEVVEGINETSDWLLTSERMLSDPAAEIEQAVDAGE